MEEFKSNLKAVWKKASFWIATTGAGVLAGWGQIPVEYRDQLFTMIPHLQTIAPLVWLVSFVVARAVPQKP